MSFLIIALLSQRTSVFAQERTVKFQCDVNVENIQSVKLTEEENGYAMTVDYSDFDTETLEIKVPATETQVLIPTANPNLTLELQWTPANDYTPHGCDAQPGETGFEVTAEIIDATLPPVQPGLSDEDPCKTWRNSAAGVPPRRLQLNCRR